MDIICSIGPSVKDIEDIKNFQRVGMTIPRFNFSHIDYGKFEILINEIHECFPNMKVLQDLQGNKLRISKLFTEAYMINPREEVVFCLEDDYKNLCEKNKYKSIKIIPIMYPGNIDDFKNVNELFMKDAAMNFKIIEKNKVYIKAITNKGGVLRAEKGINAPGLIRDNLSLTDKDKLDIEVGIKNNIDIICLSYVTKAEDILELKKYVGKLLTVYSAKKPKIWAKIECREGIDNFEEILKVSDGIMLGRGDLRAELPIDVIPYEEEKLMQRMKKSKKKFIVGTFILESMRRQDIPTISEVNDIYKYIQNNVDGLMLSTEVTVSKAPINVIEWLSLFCDKYSN